jgi:Zn-dependent protease with chaperone function
MLDIRDGRLLIESDRISRDESLDSLRFSTTLGNTPRLIHLADGSRCEVTDTRALAALLKSAGVAEDRVNRIAEKRSWVAAAVVGFIAVLLLSYFVGVPFAARVAANRMPQSVANTIGNQALSLLDKMVFEKSQIPVDRRGALSLAFYKLTMPGGVRSDGRVDFRRSNALGANALALPSGAIIVTDGLVELSKDDREILGVLAHEAGHVAHRHSLRLVMQHSAMALFLTWYVGDINTLAASAPTALLAARYSRDFEREADDYAVTVMRANGIDTHHLADILERMEADRTKRDGSPRLSNAYNNEYTSSHPTTSERLQRLRTSTRSTRSTRAPK